MTSLATIADVEARLGYSLSETETDRMEALLADVSAAIRGETHQEFTEADTTAALRIRRRRITLPQRPVTDVASVVDLDGNDIDWEWDGQPFYVVRVYENLRDSFEWVLPTYESDVAVVTYSHGYEIIPADIVGVTCSIAMRAFGQTPTLTGITNESIQGYSYSIGAAGAAGAFGVLNGEAAVLKRYKRQVGFIESRMLR